MENKKEYCGKLFKEWRELNEKMGRAQKITTEDQYKEQPGLSDNERRQLDSLGKKLKSVCSDCLLPVESNELER